MEYRKLPRDNEKIGVFDPCALDTVYTLFGVEQMGQMAEINACFGR